jgi:hypothetical protein
MEAKISSGRRRCRVYLAELSGIHRHVPGETASESDMMKPNQRTTNSPIHSNFRRKDLGVLLPELQSKASSTEMVFLGRILTRLSDLEYMINAILALLCSREWSWAPSALQCPAYRSGSFGTRVLVRYINGHQNWGFGFIRFSHL